MNRYVSIDIETTGLDKQICQLLEVGAVIDDLDNMGDALETLPKFHCYIVRDFYVGEPYALAMHAEIFKRISKREAPYSYFTELEFATAFHKFLFSHGLDERSIKVAGKNFASFDEHFLTPVFRNLPDYAKAKDMKFSHRVLDPAILYWQRDKDSWIPGSSVCMERAGMDGEVAHTALEDAQMVVELVRGKLK